MQWTIGNLAEKSGLTARTLRHWEKEQLLPPPTRRASGYRVYGPEHLAVVMQLKMLRQMGLSVPEIRDCISRCSPAETLQQHVARTRRHVEVLQQGCRQLERLAERLEEGAPATFLEGLAALTRMEEGLPPAFKADVDRLTVLRQELGQHPFILMRGLNGLEEALSALSDVQMGADEKASLVARARELQALGRAFGNDPAVRERALQQLKERMGTATVEEALEQLRAAHPPAS